jgi:hypothetical protein
VAFKSQSWCQDIQNNDAQNNDV